MPLPARLPVRRSAFISQPDPVAPAPLGWGLLTVGAFRDWIMAIPRELDMAEVVLPADPLMIVQDRKAESRGAVMLTVVAYLAPPTAAAAEAQGQTVIVT